MEESQNNYAGGKKIYESIYIKFQKMKTNL